MASYFTLTIDRTAFARHAGERPDAEARVIERVLSDVRQAVGTSGPGTAPHAITLNGDTVGEWAFGPDSRNAR